MREIYYWQAIAEALKEEMEMDQNVFVMGEDIGHYGGAFGVTRKMLEEFGKGRIIDTPISEGSVVGLAIGAAIMGLRPVVEIMFMDFITLCMDQILNHMTKYRYMFAGQVRVPIVIRTPAGARKSYGPTHSQSLESWFMHIPGLKIAVPSNSYDAKGLLKSAIRDDNPVLFVEHKILYNSKGNVPEGEYTLSFGKAEIRTEGKDISIISYSDMTNHALLAAKELRKEGISAEVIDLRTLVPLDMETIIYSVKKTGRVVISEEGWRTCGVGAEISARINEHAYEYLDAPIQRISAYDVPIPASSVLEKAVLPGYEDIIGAVKKVLRS